MTRYILLCGALLFAWAAQAQSIQPTVVNSSGGSIQNASVIVEWSLGEPAIQTIANPDHILTQGFLQPDLLISGLDDHSLEEKVTVYPNPVADYLHFKTSSTRIASLTFSDLLGRTVLERKYQSEMNIQQLPAGVYFISLLDAKNRILSTFKIVKI